MKHLVLGNGNLGIDLALSLDRHGYAVDFPQDKHHPASFKNDHHDVVWCAAGAGGPGGSAQAHFETHLMLPVALAEFAPKLILFSTAYLNRDPEGVFSDYSMSKSFMERAMAQRENVRCLRVGSLYGVHRPLRTFPGKILELESKGLLRKSAQNVVTPTPTEWLADELVETKVWESFDSVKSGSNIAPMGCCPISEWIEMICPGKSLPSFRDDSYPLASSASVVTGPHWRLLWGVNGPKVVEAARAALTKS